MIIKFWALLSYQAGLGDDQWIIPCSVIIVFEVGCNFSSLEQLIVYFLLKRPLLDLSIQDNYTNLHRKRTRQNAQLAHCIISADIGAMTRVCSCRHLFLFTGETTHFCYMKEKVRMGKFVTST